MEPVSRTKFNETFPQAIELPGAEVAQFLEQSCGQHEALRTQVIEALNAIQTGSTIDYVPPKIPGELAIGELLSGRFLLDLAVEYLPGQTLASHLAQHGKMRPEEALPVLEQIANGLDALHEQPVWHWTSMPWAY